MTITNWVELEMGSLSYFQLADTEIARFEGAKLTEVTPLNAEAYGDARQARTRIARECLGIDGVQAGLREWAESLLREVFAAEDAHSVIAAWENDARLQSEETKIAKSPEVQEHWREKEYRGVLHYYMKRANLRLACTLFGEELARGIEPEELPRAQEWIAAEGWELAWPEPERLKQIITEVKAKKITLEEGIRQVLGESPEETPAALPTPSPTPRPAGPPLEEETRQWKAFLAGMKPPEAHPQTTPEAAPSFARAIQDLIGPGTEDQKPLISGAALQRLARTAMLPHNEKSVTLLGRLLERGNDLCAGGEASPAEWGTLAAVIQEQIDQLRAAEAVQEPAGAVPTEVMTIIQALAEQQRLLFDAVGDQRIAFEGFLQASLAQNQTLADSLRRTPPEMERARWVDAEYHQEFYTRFQPNQEPHFYADLPEAERQLFDARWQLARAAYVKKAYAAFPEKQVENQDLVQLTTEQMERLYNIDGVREALEWYADVIVNGKRVRLPGGRETSIWECDEITFEQFRATMRQTALTGLSASEAKEADAVAWNLIWCGNLLESADSCYSFSGERHGTLPGVMISDDTRAVLHPEEKWEAKFMAGLEWGAFGKWAKVQMERARQETDFDSRSDDIELVAATNSSEFWKAERTQRPIIDRAARTTTQRGKIEISVPECYPVATMKSFWEETKAGDKSLLDYLLEGEEIPWREAGSGLWVNYLPIKFLNAIKLLEYFKPGKEMETRKFAYAKLWADPLIDILKRLSLERAYDDLNEQLDLELSFHNLKVWAVYAAFGGVADVSKKRPALNARDTWVIERALKDKNVRYLDGGEGLKIE